MSAPHRAKKSLGQNFLIDPNQQRRIVAALEPAPDDIVLEIGPGQGALTRHLAGTVRRLICVELDDDLAAALAARYNGRADITVVHADFMHVDVAALVADVRTIKVVGNIPYSITSPLIFRLLERDLRPRRIVLMVQQEVAERIVARAGDPDYGALSIGVRSVAHVEKLFRVARGSFRPVPGVDSTVLRIEPIEPPPLTPAEETDLRQLTRTAFGWRRKQLQKTLRSAPEYALDAATLHTVAQETGIELEQRPEQLEPDSLIRLARALRRSGRPLAAQARSP
jgi:16S rRNA (adenine1518-N6/adenine1519-N6)-dimethyltransferase